MKKCLQNQKIISRRDHDIGREGWALIVTVFLILAALVFFVGLSDAHAFNLSSAIKVARLTRQGAGLATDIQKLSQAGHNPPTTTSRRKWKATAQKRNEEADCTTDAECSNLPGWDGLPYSEFGKWEKAAEKNHAEEKQK